MTDSPFARAFKRNVRLDAPMSASARWLSDGTHEVRIVDVDTTKLDHGRIIAVFEDAKHATHRESFFLTNRAGTAPSRKFLALLAAVAPDMDVQVSLHELLSDGRTYKDALECWRGLRLRVTVARSPGYVLVVSDGEYHVTDVDARVLYSAATKEEAETWCKVREIPKSYRVITTMEAIDEDVTEHNLSALRFAFEGIKKAKIGDSAAAGVQFAEPDEAG